MKIGLQKFVDTKNERFISELKPNTNNSENSMLYLTNRRIIEYKKTGKNFKYKDIPLEHITSVEYNFNKASVGLIIISIAMVLTGFILLWMYMGGIGDIYSLYTILIGGFCLVLGAPMLMAALSKKSSLKLYSYDDDAQISFSFKKTVLNQDIEQFISKIHWQRDNQVLQQPQTPPYNDEVSTLHPITPVSSNISSSNSLSYQENDNNWDSDEDVEDFSVFEDDEPSSEDEFWSSQSPNDVQTVKSEIRNSANGLTCPACGANLPGEVKFCIECGKKFTSDQFS